MGHIKLQPTNYIIIPIRCRINDLTWNKLDDQLSDQFDNLLRIQLLYQIYDYLRDQFRIT